MCEWVYKFATDISTIIQWIWICKVPPIVCGDLVCRYEAGICGFLGNITVDGCQLHLLLIEMNYYNFNESPLKLQLSAQSTSLPIYGCAKLLGCCRLFFVCFLWLRQQRGLFTTFHYHSFFRNKVLQHRQEINVAVVIAGQSVIKQHIFSHIFDTIKAWPKFNC